MDNLEQDLDDFSQFLRGVNRDSRPKKAKPLKNYIAGYYEAMKHIEINPNNIIKELENKNWLFVGSNGEIIYNF